MTNKIASFNDVFKYVFTDMEVIEDEQLPEFWLYEDVRNQISESEYWQERACDVYEEEYDINPFDNYLTDAQREHWYEFESEYYMDLLDGVYVLYKVDGKNLDKLPDEVMTFWCEDIESYVFLQSWYGMSASFVKLSNKFEW